MDSSPPSPLRTGQILVAALLFGMLSFAGLAAAMAGRTGGAPNPDLANTLFLILGALAISEIFAYQLLFRPMFIRQVRAQALALNEPARTGFVNQRFLSLTIIAAALAEGLGLFGAVTVLVTGRLEALAVPALAALALLLTIPTLDRLERFMRQVAGDNPFPPSTNLP